jgi:hypothetical protein
MPLLEAPSISITSNDTPRLISTQFSHFPHGVEVGPLTQLSDFATMRAIVVLPTPRGPEKR